MYPRRLDIHQCDFSQIGPSDMTLGQILIESEASEKLFAISLNPLLRV
jgi:hypothetical protein